MSEAAPLLHQSAGDDPPMLWTRAEKTTILLVACGGVFGQLADILRFAPSMQLFELGYCRRYYLETGPALVGSDGSVLEHYCKLSSIQEDLSWLKARQTTIEGLIGMILVLPYGSLAEVTGARFVVQLNTIGHALSTAWIITTCYFWKSFSPDAAVASSLFRVIGGGNSVERSVSLAIVANAVPTSKRSTVFFFLGALTLFTEAIGPLISSAFLARSHIYGPMLLGFIFEALAILCIHYVPLDTPTRRVDHSSHASDETTTVPFASTSLLNRVLGSPQDVLDRHILVLLFAFATTKWSRLMLEMLVQYTSKRFSWSFAQANILLSIRASIAFVVLLVVLPSIKSCLQSRLQFRPERVDFWIGLTSTAFFACGSLLMGLSDAVPPFFLGLVVFTLARGGQEALQSFLTSLVAKEKLIKLYTYIALFNGLGVAIGGLLINGALKEGMHRGGAWLGLPFFIGAGAYFLSFFGVLVVR
ncbi:hypothetical protein K461DRAFT_321471 [Myriangium duriaei CBS 260.36]|uniref:Major facilitator superfamily (MFS) profile domain-containing protein n=1 Tax=Myriangium duriaei CBS 260.36 TaxID=1168546 RepID=A0A9P4MGU3_9PEZI|nr:hypothetical protein K461DRAFT_321471 [Myriangium duriaei CBS 260.36]